jgi:maleylacetate reductase
VIVRFGLEELPPLLGELGIESPFVVAGRRWSELELPRGPRWHEIPSHRVSVPEGVDGVLAVGGGSAVDTGKVASASSGLPLVSVPTTYSGAEWTPSFGVRNPERLIVGRGTGAHLAGIVYEPELTLGLPRAETVGTALNALAHCAEALYAEGRSEDGDREALAGAALISRWLPEVVERPADLEARTRLLEGAMHAGAALATAGLALGHALAQAIGGRYGISHGALNAVCLPAALRFNRDVASDAIERLGAAMGTGDPIGLVEKLAGLGGFGRLRELGVPEAELDAIAEAAAERPGALANPRPAPPDEIAELMRTIW